MGQFTDAKSISMVVVLNSLSECMKKQKRFKQAIMLGDKCLSIIENSC
jgi:hypothetical protein